MEANLESQRETGLHGKGAGQAAQGAGFSVGHIQALRTTMQTSVPEDMVSSKLAP